MTSSDWDRAVPHDLQAERAVLGSLLVAPEGLGEVAAVLAVEDFYRAAHRHVYVAIRELAEQGRAVDLLTVRDQLRARGWLDEVGPAYLASLVDGVPRTLNRSFYAGIVRTHADRARLMRLARRLLVDAADVECDVGEVLAAAQRDVGRLAQQRDVAGGRVPNHVSHISEVMEEVVEALRAGPPSFVDTPYPALTSMLGGGIAPGELAFLGARPGLGKTAMALEIARRAGKKGTSVFVVSREMLTLALANIVSGDVDHDGFSKRFGVKVSYQCAPSMFKPLSGAQLARALAFAVISAEGMYGDLKGVLSAFGVDLKKVEAEVLAEEKAAEQKSAAPAKSSAKPGKAPAKKPVAKAGKKAKKR